MFCLLLLYFTVILGVTCICMKSVPFPRLLTTVNYIRFIKGTFICFLLQVKVDMLLVLHLLNTQEKLR